MGEHGPEFVAEDEGGYIVGCQCGEEFRGIGLSDAGGLFDLHIAQTRSEKRASDG